METTIENKADEIDSKDVASNASIEDATNDNESEETCRGMSQQEESKEEIIEVNETIEENTHTEHSLSGIASALKSDLKAQVEAVLFVSDLPLKTGAISKMLNASYDDVQSALVQLIQEYEDRNGGLEIGTDDGYIIQVRTQYLNIVTDMMPLELNPGPMRTLSAIALKEPVLQSEVVDMRGSGAYDHINELVEMELVSKKPQGLSYVLKTTNKFKQYFRLTKEANKIKEKLQEEAQRRAKEKEAVKLAEAENTQVQETLE